MDLRMPSQLLRNWAVVDSIVGKGPRAGREPSLPAAGRRAHEGGTYWAGAFRTAAGDQRPKTPGSREPGYFELYALDLGHEEPAILLTNQHHASPKALIARYGQRMLIENPLSDAIRFFHMDALSSAVGLKVDYDMALLVVASGLYRLLARRMREYADCRARQIFRDLISMPANITVTEDEVQVSLLRRAHLPIVLASGLMDQPVPVPWWGGKKLRLTTYCGPAPTLNP